MVLIKVLQTAVEAYKSGRCFSVVKVAVIGFSKRKTNDYLNLNTTIHCLSCHRYSRTQHIVNARRMCRSHDSEEHDVSSDEEQRPSEVCDCSTSKKCQHSIGTCGTKGVGFCFYFCIISQEKRLPFCKHKEQFNCFYTLEDQKCKNRTLLLWSRVTTHSFIHFLYTTAHLKT